MGLDGPSKTIIVEPQKLPDIAPPPEREPVPEKEPTKVPDKEPVPA